MSITHLELKRKLFHHLTLVYMAMYAFLPRWLAVSLMLIAIVIVGIVEFLRLRRPELNAWFLNKFSSIHRVSEVMKPSGVFWALLGAGVTMIVFTSRAIVLPALGFLTFGDTAAALGGQKWGRHHWPKNPDKTYEGTLCFFVVAAAWALIFVRWPVALLAAAAAAWGESQRWRWNDNFWIPVFSAVVLSVLNLFLGRR